MSYTPLYIATTDITDSLARDFINGSDARVDKWMERTDGEIQSMALSLGVPVGSIYTPLNSRVKEYAVAYFCFLLFQDTNGENDTENPENEVYLIKLKWYMERVGFLQTQITRELLTNVMTSVTAAGMVSTGIMWRG